MRHLLSPLTACLIFSFALGGFVLGASFASRSHSYSYQANQDLGDDDSVTAVRTGTTDDLVNDDDDDDKDDDDQSLPPVTHVETPSAVKAIYMTSCAVATPSMREDLVSLIDDTEINSVIIDIKDYSGTISYEPENSDLTDVWEDTRCPVRDMREFVADLHEQKVYVIGRITVFQDPYLAQLRPEWALKSEETGELWADKDGLFYTDPGVREVWDYHIDIAKDAYRAGFDELNFDYIRFPSDGRISDLARTVSVDDPKEVVIENFFRYLSKELKDTRMFSNDSPVISADLFGMVTTADDDLGIGQILERALPYFDYIAPMVYPSHYPPHFNGWDNPNSYPYEVVNYALTSAVERTVATSTPLASMAYEFVDPAGTSTPSSYYKKPVYDKDKIRTWIQDFDYGGDYTAEDVRAQIQATYDAGLDSWMIWDPRNVYTKAALEPAQ